jgi:hypothetical protein
MFAALSTMKLPAIGIMLEVWMTEEAGDVGELEGIGVGVTITTGDGALWPGGEETPVHPFTMRLQLIEMLIVPSTASSTT